MSGGAAYLLAHLLAVIPGLPLAWIEPVRSWRWPARGAAAFAAGCIALALEAIVVAFFGAQWSIPALLLLPALPAIWLARRSLVAAGPPAAAVPRLPALFAVAAAAVALGMLAARISSAQATSVDLLLFWGAKAVKFAQVQTIDPVLLADPFFSHARPFYPPLLPVVDALAVQVAGGMPWNAAPMTVILWCAAAALILFEILSRRGVSFALTATALWTVAIAASLGVSFSGGNAEAPLLLYLSAAGAALMMELPDDPARRRWLAGILLAGAVLIKVEGVVAGVLLLAATALRDCLPGVRRPLGDLVPIVLPPLLAGGLWAAFVARFGLSLASPGRGTFFEIEPGRLPRVLDSMGKGLEAGTSHLSWWVAL
ncbi:MAG TPA: hypothetical protein VIE39_00880, partial [Thermoanaerobaculia bacterium]